VSFELESSDRPNGLTILFLAGLIVFCVFYFRQCADCESKGGVLVESIDGYRCVEEAR
jgi:hypothetical protein